MTLGREKEKRDTLSRVCAQKRDDHQKELYTILSTRYFLAWQGLLMCGNHVSHDSGEFKSNFFSNILKLHAQDTPILNVWLQRSQFTSPVIQNEMLETMATNMLQGIVKKVVGMMFPVVINGTRDASTTEQLVLSLCYVDDQLLCHEGFTVLHCMASTTSQSITYTIKVEGLCK